MRTLSIAVMAVAAGSLSLSSGCSRKPATLTDKYDEVAMEAAIRKARDSFEEFKQRLLDPREGDEHFAVKVKIEDENGIEHFWLGGVEIEADAFTGVINNEPGIVKNVKLGDTYGFTFDDVSDWMYMSKGMLQGNYTLRVLLKSMPKDQADRLKDRIGW